MNVYIEYLILENMAVNALIIYASLYILKAKVKLWRLLAGSAAGTLCAVFMPLILLPDIFTFILKQSVAVIIVLVIAKYRRKKDYFIALIIFYMISFLLGGIVFALAAGGGYGGSIITGNGIIGIIAVSALVMLYILNNTVAYIKYKMSGTGRTSIVLLCNENKKAELTGLYDSGNNLNYNGSGVIIITEEIKKNLNFTVIDTVEVMTITGSEKLPLVIIPEMTVRSAGRTTHEKEVYAVITKQKLRQYDVILHSSMEVQYDKEVVAKNT